MTVHTLSNSPNGVIPEHHILHFGPTVQGLLPPWNDDLEASTLARLTVQVGSVARALLPAAKAEYEASRARQSELRASRDALRKDLSAAYARHEQLLKPLHAELQRIEKAREKAANAIMHQETTNGAERSVIENALAAIQRELAGLPAHKKSMLDNAAPQPAPTRLKRDDAPPLVKVRALAKVCVGVDRNLEPGDTAELDAEPAAFLVAIGKVKRVA